MNNTTAQLFTLFSKILDYPQEKTAFTQFIDSAIHSLPNLIPEVRHELQEFCNWMNNHRLGELQEAYSEYFDMNYNTHLYIGTHLFGESYFRSGFILKLKEEYKQADFNYPTNELPDHASVMFAFLSTSPLPEVEHDLVELLHTVFTRIVKHVTGNHTSMLQPIFKDDLGLEQEGTALKTTQPLQLTLPPTQTNPYFHVLRAVQYTLTHHMSFHEDTLQNQLLKKETEVKL